ncbi:hypothetical protein BJV78DRAFT_1289065 [Lactifluus subvellereus]|nr:hypothetical protein BJV78DRAFT_1289065 [Lactifluus subvellereus]
MMFVKTIIALSLAILAVAVPQPQAGVDGDMLSNQIVPRYHLSAGRMKVLTLFELAIDVIDSGSSALEVSTSALSGSNAHVV